GAVGDDAGVGGVQADEGGEPVRVRAAERLLRARRRQRHRPPQQPLGEGGARLRVRHRPPRRRRRQAPRHQPLPPGRPRMPLPHPRRRTADQSHGGDGRPQQSIGRPGAGGGEDGSEEKQNKTAELHDEEKESDDKQVIDAVFLVVGFLRRLVKAAEGVSRDAVDEGFKSTHMQDIVTDMIKLENQLPLKLILDVVEHVQDAARAVAADTKFEGLRECLEGYKLGFNPATFFDDVVRPFCWYYSPFFNKQLPAVDRGLFD
uniref:Uncharacterized protein n=1 Tax=Aegilops tauschii subsp. strangulata TaxID=200361 RepID=A0A453QSZ9_AEGTS